MQTGAHELGSGKVPAKAMALGRFMWKSGRNWDREDQRRDKKEEFQGTMFDMLPGNSFPRSALFLKAV